MLALEADVLRQQKINSIYPPAVFFPAGANPLTFRFSSPQVLSEKLSSVSHKIGIPKCSTNVHETRMCWQVIRQSRCPSRNYHNSPDKVLYISRICFLPRPPACLPLRVTACGQHGYWFSPVTTYPENVEFELVVEGKASEVSFRLSSPLCLKHCIASGHIWEDTKVFTCLAGS